MAKSDDEEEVPTLILLQRGCEEFNIWTPPTWSRESSPRSPCRGISARVGPGFASLLEKQQSCIARSQWEETTAELSAEGIEDLSRSTADGSSEALATVISSQEVMIESLMMRCRRLESVVKQQRAELVERAEQVRALCQESRGASRGAHASRASSRAGRGKPERRPKVDSLTCRAAAGIARKVHCQEYQHPLRSVPASHRSLTSGFRPQQRISGRGRSIGALAQNAYRSAGHQQANGPKGCQLVYAKVP